MRRGLLSILLALALLPSVGRAAPVDPRIARRKLVEVTHDPKTLDARIGITRSSAGSWWSGKGKAVRRNNSEPERATHYQAYAAAVSRLVDLDPKRELLSPSEWKHVAEGHQWGNRQVRSKAEHIEFILEDPAFRLKQTNQLVEKVRGRLASVLVQALKGKRPDPETLAHVAAGLSKKYPFFENDFHRELFIADMRGIAPKLAAWDFGRPKPAPGSQEIVLPPKIKRVVRDLGQRAFSNVNVLFADHLYTDAHVMVDAMMAMGLDPKNARYVTTPYPFDANVMAGIEKRGISVAHAPYDKEATQRAVEKAMGELIERSKENHQPILVMDDGGMAARAIAEKFPSEMHRFRVVEITKGGEREAKAALPKALQIDWGSLGTFDAKQLAAVKERYLTAHGADSTSRAAAEKYWNARAGHERSAAGAYSRMGTQENHWQNKLPEHSFGFAHYTYSDSKYKREVMTPLYTHAVNLATHEALEHQGIQLANKRVTIIGGGAMGINAGIELRDKGYEVTFVEPDDTRRKLIETEHKFPTSELKPALKGRGQILELSGIKNLITAEHLFLMDDNTVVVHGSSKDNPFDMGTIKALASETHDWKRSPTGQASASYVFEAGGRKRTLHFPGNGFTISHGGKTQNVPLKKFLPEVEALLRLSVHAVQNDATVTQYPFYGTPETLMKPGVQRKALRNPQLSLELDPPDRH